ncbi:hypothetical protein TSA1_18690 [Bradyrhizobium nitroreducens]|uniref:Uncharacterized protein n=1 Tax=Bradyrhizobium nitroreducens TaxID=709803 RepID=A0A2M6UD86_9BRAD|nr:hypothetical protein [Bradyrhizobium nitroreducens]PIT02556.1 hypothetical protein TSA1_18690 [Bradyrhizobium nitroreducens]
MIRQNRYALFRIILQLQSANGPPLHFEYCWSHFCMHFVPVHFELLQLNHFRSHMDARAEAGAVDHANRTIAQQVKAVRRLTWMVVVAIVIPIPLVEWSALERCDGYLERHSVLQI